MIDLIDLFDERTLNWEEQLAHDEWFFVGIRNEIIGSVSPAEAFALLPQAVTLVLRDQEYDDRTSTCIQILLALARSSESTEMPHQLSLRWEELMSRICSFGEYEERQAAELSRWYRRVDPATD